MKPALPIMAILLVGCAAKPPRENLPPAEWHTHADALRILADRAAALRTVSAQGLMTMRRPDGESVRLDIVLVGQTDGRLRLRAWKLGRAVFDLTMTPQGIWMLLPDDKAIRERIRSSQSNISRIASSWDLFNGQFFTRRDVTLHDAGSSVVAAATIDGSRVTCEIDGDTLAPRRYILRDDCGTQRFSLTLSQYQQFNKLPFAQRYLAKSEFGEVDIKMHDVEINGELAEAAFVPPKRAEKLQ
jgi:hypothetical protein